jgi:ribosome recycling factor
MPLESIFAEADQHMRKTIDRLHTDFSTVRTGRASPALLDGVKVNYYGSPVPINQVGNIVVAEARVIEIRPWDMSVLPELEKAISGANLGVTPNSDGKVVRLTFPSLTEDRRKDLVKVVKKLAEDFRISLRNIRREAIEKVKKAEKDKAITQDVRMQSESRMQGMTDAYIKKIDDILSGKEKEILEV